VQVQPNFEKKNYTSNPNKGNINERRGRKEEEEEEEEIYISPVQTAQY
jgi:hypothetical protein